MVSFSYQFSAQFEKIQATHVQVLKFVGLYYGLHVLRERGQVSTNPTNLHCGGTSFLDEDQSLKHGSVHKRVWQREVLEITNAK